jgi:protein tyrosine phosphatase (PTP) superfamily phosphohydrolase (DUF442 family)
VFRATLIVIAVMIVGNLSILATHALAYAKAGQPAPTEIDGLGKLRVVDARVWRGNAPGPEAYAALADAGVTTVVDLRAEDDLDEPDALIAAAGIERHHLPIRDGQTPTQAEIDQFMRIVDESEGTVYLHCGAGVGRTGAMAAAYLVGSGQASTRDALTANLAIGPPSVEQIWFAASIDESAETPAPVKWASRVLDGPRRLWSRYGL